MNEAWVLVGADLQETNTQQLVKFHYSSLRGIGGQDHSFGGLDDEEDDLCRAISSHSAHLSQLVPFPWASKLKSWKSSASSSSTMGSMTKNHGHMFG